MKLSTLSIALLLQGVCYGQNILYKQSNKILTYDYGVVDTAGMRKLSEIEKIKYELKFTQQSYSETIDQNYESQIELKVDSNEYEQPWMKLAKRIKYSMAGTELYDDQNALIKLTSYTSDQLANRAERKDEIRDNGFHPGLISFPSFSNADIAKLDSQNVVVSNLPNGEVKVVYDGRTTIFNKYKYTVVEEYIDDDGKKNRETKGYEPYMDNKGYLLRIYKKERFVNSVNGPCITETKLCYYNNYVITDNGGLIDKAIRFPETIELYPNPNDGVFTVKVNLNNNVNITSVKVINVLTGVSIPIDYINQKTFLVNLPNLTTGQYVLQVTTSEQKALSYNFFKN